jgi:hypothetical protein
MGLPFVVRVTACALTGGLFLGALSGCHRCGLGEHDRVTVTGVVDGSAGAAFKDVALKGQTSDAEFSLSNTNMPTQPGGVDAFLVQTSCNKLFDGPYPGAAPLCPILDGPAKPGGVSSRVKLSPGTYRVYLQGYSNVVDSVGYLVDVYIWDYSCRGTL